jgi:hypothetical protein
MSKQGQITLDIQITGSSALLKLLNTLVESVDPNLLTREDNSIQHFI